MHMWLEPLLRCLLEVPSPSRCPPGPCTGRGRTHPRFRPRSFPGDSGVWRKVLVSLLSVVSTEMPITSCFGLQHVL